MHLGVARARLVSRRWRWVDRDPAWERRRRSHRRVAALLMLGTMPVTVAMFLVFWPLAAMLGWGILSFLVAYVMCV